MSSDCGDIKGNCPITENMAAPEVRVSEVDRNLRVDKLPSSVGEKSIQVKQNKTK